MDAARNCQVIMATHAPILMACPNARLLAFTKYGLEPVTLDATEHFRLVREFCADPAAFVEERLRDEEPAAAPPRSDADP
jgi:predicted ATPase